MGSQCYIVEDPLYIEVPSSIVLKRHSDNHLALENPREMWADNSLRTSKRHKFNVYLYQSGDQHSSLPYAARSAVEEKHSNKISYPRVERGKNILMPEYNSFNDPHLQQYYKNKFQVTSCKKKTVSALPRSRPVSRPGSARSNRSVTSSGGQEYHVSVKTGDVKGAGTNARVFVTLYGSKGKMTKRRLHSENNDIFSRGSELMFTVYGPDIGDLVKADVEHDGIGEQQSWYLEQVSVECNGRTWTFPCNQWLSLQRGDGKIDRQLVPKGSQIKGPAKQVPFKKLYTISTITGDIRGAGTDANVFITVFGKKGRTPKIQLSNGSDTFERGQSDIFKIKTNNLDPIQKIRIEHDNSGFGPGWHLDKVTISSEDSKYYFHCNNWLADDVGDKQTVRDIAASTDPTGASACVKYIVTVVTGDKLGAGTDADVYLQMFGELGETVEKRLDNARNNFERAKTDVFPLEVPNLGVLKRAVIRHDNSGPSPAWYCCNVSVNDGKETYVFPCNRWLAEDEGDGKIQVELWTGEAADEPSGQGVNYIVTTYTCNERGAGTDANVHLIMYSTDDSSSGKIVLRRDTLNAFKRGRQDEFEIQAAPLTPLDRIVIGHDDSGSAAGWKLSKVTVECPSAGLCQTFLCDKWLAKSEGDGLIERELSELLSARREQAKQSTYEVWIWTSDIRAAGTDSNVSLQMYGETGQTDTISLDNKSNNFERGSLDKFTVSAPVVGALYKIRIWHDDSSPAAGWHLDKVQVYEPESGRKALFRCGRWLDRGEDDNETVRELPAVSGGQYPTPLPVVQYTVAVTTGKKAGAGTDADVYLCVAGERGDTGDRWLRKSTTGINKFERGDTNEFTISAVSLGELRKIRLGHNNEGASPGWFCESITVTGTDVQGGGALTFLVNRIMTSLSRLADMLILMMSVVLFVPKLVVRIVHDVLYRYYPESIGPTPQWLADDEDDGAVIREVFADSEAALLRTTLYKIKIKTGDVMNAGTDSDVYCCLYGDKGNTGQIKLREAIHTKNKFERDREDTFELEREDLGKLERMTIGHDGSGISSGWYLDCVEVVVAGTIFIFPCEKWLSKHEEDGKIERDLYPVEDSTKYLAKVPYQVELTTSDISGAGTNADVFVQLYGSEGKGAVVNLDNKSDNFERGEADTFKIECRDIGEVHKLRVGHNGKGAQSGWHLEKVVVYKATQKLTPHNARWDKTSVKKYYFTCNRWLARSEDDGEIVRELIATDENGVPISSAEVITYTVSIHTSDVTGAGTDSDIFVTLYGENGDSGERSLRKSDNINKFERNQVDVFNLSAVDLGTLSKVKIRQDDSGTNAAWHCSHVEVAVEGRPTRVFPCQRWLATDEDDGQISRELAILPEGMTISDAAEASLLLAKQRTTYHVTVYTGDLFGAGTDSDVMLQLFGATEDSGTIHLKSCKSNSINKFERDAKDLFYVECIDVGNVDFLKVWNDGAGVGSDWYLERISVDIPSLGVKRTFPCEEWFGKDESDGTLEKTLYPAVEADQSYKKSTRWEITVYTSDIRHAGTDAEVYINLFGNKGRSGRVVLGDGLKDSDQFFERGSVDVFSPEIPDIGSELLKLQVGHDGKGRGDGWHCEKVVAKCLDEDDSSVVYTFPCGRWLDKEEDDGQLQVDLLAETVVKKTVKGEETNLESSKLKNESYTIKVLTGDKFGAGTDANCYISLHGTLGDSGERQLSKSENMDKFQRNQVDTFTVDCVELGEIYKIVVREDDANIGADWFVESVTVVDTNNNESSFPCEQWFSKSKGDKKIKRTLYPKGMTMEQVEAAEKGTKKGITLKEVDGKTINENITEEAPQTDSTNIKFLVTIETGPESDMGTDADAYIVLKSGEESSEELSLYHTGEEEEFIPARVQEFEVEGEDIGDITSIVIGHNGVLASEGWFISTINVTIPTTGARYHFQCQRWLAKDRGDRKLVVEFIPSSVQEFGSKIPHVMTISTADVAKAGTDTDVIVKVFGEKGSSEPITISSNNGVRFMRAMTVNLPIELPDMGTLTRIRAEVADRGNNWLFDKITLKNSDSGEEFIFANTEWIEKGGSIDVPVQSEDVNTDKVLYKISVQTSDLFACGTDANVSAILYGDSGDSGTLALKNSSTNTNKFERNNTDEFEFSLLSLGTIKRIRIWHDDSTISASWHLAKVTVVDTSSSQEFIFTCNKWLSSRKDDKNLSRDLMCDNLPEEVVEVKKGYEIIISVSNKKDAGTNHEIWVSLEGKSGSSDKFQLKNNAGRFFDKSTSDLFFFECADLGDITHLRVGLSPREGVDVGKDAIKQCHLHQVTVNRSPGGETEHVFVCNHWLSLPGTPGRKSYRKLAATSSQPVNPDHPARIRSAPAASSAAAPSLTTYNVDVKTADKFAAGTDANIFVTLYGNTGDSGKQALVGSGKNLFERNEMSSFALEMADLGKIVKMRIEHDNSGLGASWCLDNVVVTNVKSGDKYTFPCNQWIDKKKGNKELFRVLWPEGRKVDGSELQGPDDQPILEK